MQDTRFNARKHGLAAAAHSEPAAADLLAELVPAEKSTLRPQSRAAERLVESFFEIRRVQLAKIAAFERGVALVGPEVSGLEGGNDDAQAHRYALGYPQALPHLVRIRRYEARAASQFLSAFRRYLLAEEQSQSFATKRPTTKQSGAV